MQAEINTAHKGAINEMLATCWLLDQGFEVFENVAANGPIDIIAVRPGGNGGSEVTFIDVKGASLDKYGSLSFVGLTPRQREIGVKLLVVGGSYVGWAENAPKKRPPRTAAERRRSIEAGRHPSSSAKADR